MRAQKTWQLLLCRKAQFVQNMFLQRFKSGLIKAYSNDIYNDLTLGLQYIKHERVQL